MIDGPILEIGCGTGSFTVHLIELFADRQIIVSDLSQHMLEKCKRRVQKCFGAIPKTVHFSVIDGETFEDLDKFAIIVSSFTLQWLLNLENALTSLLRSIKHGGKFFFSIPSDQSFPEWKRLCHEADVPFTGNPLPTAASFKAHAAAYSYPCHTCEQSLTYTYPSLLHFLREIKASGASTSTRQHWLQSKQLLRLINYSKSRNPGEFLITYRVIFGQITKK